MRSFKKKLIERSKLSEIVSTIRDSNRTVVTTNGCFDLLHLGHIEYLSQARELGDILIVGINSDESIRKIKGPSRPLQNEKTRALQVAALESVDQVFVFTEATPVEWLRQVRPQIHVKGADYLDKEMPERAAVESWGGRIELIPLLEGYSTTHLIQRLEMLSNEKRAGGKKIQQVELKR
jgi:rfaE bifunctional protein nucleotidyltransferase chain/domain